MARATAESAEPTKQPDSKGKMLGGITGKGWLPGQSGNPGGRPKTRPIKAVLQDMAAEELTIQGKDGSMITKPRLQWLLEAAWAKASSGDVNWAKEILQRMFGKVKDEMSLTIGDLDGVVKQIIEVVEDHVDAETAAAIAEELSELSIPGQQ